jgi:hypothetical protein
MRPEADAYRRKADECRLRAVSAANSDEQASWMRVSDAWLAMASHPFHGLAVTRYPIAIDSAAATRTNASQPTT